jgi:hypothetical protein
MSTSESIKPPNPEWYLSVVRGEIASKSNSRKLVTIGGKPRFIKSKKARQYADTWDLQARRRSPLFEADVILAVRVYYASRQPDLDITHLKDLLQGYAYENDRQVKMEFPVWAMDREDPRVEIIVAPREEWREAIDFLMQFDDWPYVEWPLKTPPEEYLQKKPDGPKADLARQILRKRMK